MKLYTADQSPGCQKALILCHELGLTFENVKLDVRQGANRMPEYLAKNPMGKVPTLEDDDGYTLWESAAILVYLAAKDPERAFLATDARGRAETMRWMFWNACHMDANVLELAMERWVKPKVLGQPTDEAVCERAQKQLDRYLPVLNAHLETRQYVNGTYGIADIALGVAATLASNVSVDLTPYTHIRAWLGRLQARDAWRKVFEA